MPKLIVYSKPVVYSKAVILYNQHYHRLKDDYYCLLSVKYTDRNIDLVQNTNYTLVYCGQKYTQMW